MPPPKPAARAAARPAAPARTAPAAARRPAAGAPATKKFKYVDDDDAVVSQHATASSGGFDGIFQSQFPVFKYKEGENEIRILPRTFDYEKLGVQAHWAFPVFVHFGIGPDRNSYLCRRLMLGETCGLCEERRMTQDADELKALRPAQRYVAWLIDRSDVKTGPKLWAMPPEKVEKEICLRSKIKSSGAILKITNPDLGYDVSFTVQKKGDFPQYGGVDISREPSPILDDPAQVAKWLDFIADSPIDKCLRWFDDRYIMQVFAGTSAKADPDLDAPPADGTARGRIADDAGEGRPDPELTGEVGDAGGEDGEITPESIMAMDETGLAEFFAAQDGWGELDLSQYDDDLFTAALSVAQHFFPDFTCERPEPEVEVEPDPPAGPIARTPAAPARPAARSPVEAAKARLAAVAPTARR